MPGRKVAVYPNIVEKRSLAVSLDSFQACLMKLQEARLDKLPVNRHQPFRIGRLQLFRPASIDADEPDAEFLPNVFEP